MMISRLQILSRSWGRCHLDCAVPNEDDLGGTPRSNTEPVETEPGNDVIKGGFLSLHGYPMAFSEELSSHSEVVSYV